MPNEPLTILIVAIALGIGWGLAELRNAIFGGNAEQDAYDKGWRDRAALEKHESTSKL